MLGSQRGSHQLGYLRRESLVLPRFLALLPTFPSTISSNTQANLPPPYHVNHLFLYVSSLQPLLKILKSHELPPTALKFSPSADLLLSASVDNTVRVIVIPSSFDASESDSALFFSLSSGVTSRRRELFELTCVSFSLPTTPQPTPPRSLSSFSCSSSHSSRFSGRPTRTVSSDRREFESLVFALARRALVLLFAFVLLLSFP